MKKLIYLIVLTLILGLVLTGCLLSNVGQVPATEQSGISYLTKGGTTEAEAEEFVLYAGQYENVGVVKVWNDTENLYVKYIVDDPWCLIETHLHVAARFEDIPQTKKGNPIPGQFDYEGEHDCEPYFLYTIPLAGLNVELYIAAHAVVADTSIEMEEIVVSRPDIDVYGPLGVYADLGDLSWGSVNLAVAAWVHPSWPSILGATWISTAYYTEEPVANNSWRWFHDEITLPEKGYYIAGSVVLATADNAEEVYFNGVLIGSNNNWRVISNYPIVPQPGLNTLDFIVRNSTGSSNPEYNPTGLIYKTTISYYPEESAWAGEIPLPGNNWATCFTYVLHMPLWNSTGEAGVGYTCAGGALKTVDGPYGFVILNTDASGGLIVEFVLKNATPSADFQLYINQVKIEEFTCMIKTPNMVDELTTDSQGDGNAHFNLPRWVDADKFWVSAMELPMPYYPIHGLMLRCEAVVLD